MYIYMMSYSRSFVSLFPGAVIVVTLCFKVPVDKFPYPTGMTGLSLFCHLIDTKFLIFTMGKASVLMVMCLAIERWFASVKPLQYRIQFSSRRLACYITTIWISNCVLQLYRLSRRIPSEDGCRWAEETLRPISLKAMVISYVFVTFVIPSFVTWVSFLHIWISVRKSPAMNTASGIQTKTRLLHMCVLTALFLTLCWLPDQLNYILSIFKVTSLSSPISDYFLVLALSNSCINPWIYCLANEEFRKEFRKLFSFRICCSAKIPFKSSSYCLRSKDIVKDLEMVLDNTV